MKDVETSLRLVSENPAQIAEFVRSWNAVFERSAPSQADIDALETSVDDTLTALSAEDAGLISPQLRQMINALPYAVMVVDRDGQLRDMNETALAHLPVSPGDAIDTLPYAIEGGQDLSDVIRAGLLRRNAASSVIIKRAPSTASEKAATLVFVPTVEARNERMLVFIVDRKWSADIQAFLTTAYGLTGAESAVLLAFLEGHTQKEIAQLRGTSAVTVRTQIQTILNKSGASSQTELMRDALSFSHFFQDVSPIAATAKHPFRKEFSVLGKDGRTIDLLLSGDLKGDLIISLQDATLRGFPAQVEKGFAKAGLCVAVICRPGIGKTDPPGPECGYLETIANDIATVADQLGRERFVLMTNYMSSVFVYQVAPLLADRLKRIVIKSTMVPSSMLDPNDVQSPLAQALLRARKQSKGIYRAMVYAAIKAWKVIGSRRLHIMQLKGFAPDLEATNSPEVIEAFDEAMHATLAQGTDYPILVFEYAAEDWGRAVAKCPVPITLLQGRHDPSISYASVTGFAAQYSENMTIYTFEDGGYLTFMTHTDEFIEQLCLACRFNSISV
ncbi:MAG: PAS domain-containing protein [Litoreibacter sp.]|nr:PAS domain-containing protein [Litoreibacter sp.]